jgi:hypothetical protein
MSYMLPHLNNGWEVDQAILCEEERVVVSWENKLFIKIDNFRKLVFKN